MEYYGSSEGKRRSKQGVPNKVGVYDGKAKYTHTRETVTLVGSGPVLILASPDYKHLWMAGSVTQTWQTGLKRKK